jgi:hypothetical protein
MPPVNAEFSDAETEDSTMTNYATEARSHAEVEELLDRLHVYISEHQTYPRKPAHTVILTYEDGVFDALRWVYGLTDEHPFPLDEEL